MQFVLVHLESISLYFIVPTYHIAIDTVETNRTKLVFTLLIILLIVTLFMENMRTGITDHSLIYCYRVTANTANQVTNMTMMLHTLIFTTTCIIFLQVSTY